MERLESGAFASGMSDFAFDMAQDDNDHDGATGGGNTQADADDDGEDDGDQRNTDIAEVVGEETAASRGAGDVVAEAVRAANAIEILTLKVDFLVLERGNH